MLYVKIPKNCDSESVMISDSTMFARCTDCGREFPVTAEMIAADAGLLTSAVIRCDNCARIVFKLATTDCDKLFCAGCDKSRCAAHINFFRR